MDQQLLHVPNVIAAAKLIGLVERSYSSSTEYQIHFFTKDKRPICFVRDSLGWAIVDTQGNAMIEL